MAGCGVPAVKVRFHTFQPDALGPQPQVVWSREAIRPEPGSMPRNALPVRLYAYRGTGRDELTAFMDDEPETFPPGRPVSQPCGTPAAYKRHLRHGETPCDDCRQAERVRAAGNRRTA